MKSKSLMQLAAGIIVLAIAERAVRNQLKKVVEDRKSKILADYDENETFGDPVDPKKVAAEILH